MAGIYLHIPFCKQACNYCNFHFSTSLRARDEMVAALIREAELQRDYLGGEKIETIYFGGGTPSLLPVDDLQRIVDALFRNFRIEELKECTLEANPDDLSRDYLKALRSTPVSRFSMGVQSFRNEDLRYMNRAHNAQQADYAIKAAQDAGFTNLSIDLIYGTPGLSDAAWKENIRKAASLGIQHLSAYALTVEEGTALEHAIRKRKSAPVDTAQSAAQFALLMEESAKLGYEQYEISNFAKPGCYAVHNTAYWQGVPYLGLGPSAHSFDGKRERRWNVANNALYLQSILRDNKLPSETETLTAVQRLNEYIMTSLRTVWGTDLERVGREWGADAETALLQRAGRFIESGRAILQDGKLVLSSEGKLFADGIAADLFQED